jgi:hypothetical protein
MCTNLNDFIINYKWKNIHFYNKTFPPFSNTVEPLIARSVNKCIWDDKNVVSNEYMKEYPSAIKKLKHTIYVVCTIKAFASKNLKQTGDLSGF